MFAMISMEMRCSQYIKVEIKMTKLDFTQTLTLVGFGVVEHKMKSINYQ